MSEATYEQILQDVWQLPAVERRKLLAELARAEEGVPPVPAAQSVSAVRSKPTFNDRRAEMRWLREHQREYAKQWVGLEGDQLIAHSENAKEVFAAMDAAGIEVPFVTYVEDPDAPPYAGSSLCL